MKPVSIFNSIPLSARDLRSSQLLSHHLTKDKEKDTKKSQNSNKNLDSTNFVMLFHRWNAIISFIEGNTKTTWFLLTPNTPPYWHKGTISLTRGSREGGGGTQIGWLLVKEIIISVQLWTVIDPDQSPNLDNRWLYHQTYSAFIQVISSRFGIVWRRGQSGCWCGGRIGFQWRFTRVDGFLDEAMFLVPLHTIHHRWSASNYVIVSALFLPNLHPSQTRLRPVTTTSTTTTTTAVAAAARARDIHQRGFEAESEESVFRPAIAE